MITFFMKIFGIRDISSIKQIPQVNFKLSDINLKGSKFLRFDFNIRGEKYQTIRIGHVVGFLDKHYKIKSAFIKELKNILKINSKQAEKLIKKAGGGCLKMQEESLVIEDSSIDFGQEKERNLTVDILENNLKCKVSTP